MQPTRVLLQRSTSEQKAFLQEWMGLELFTEAWGGAQSHSSLRTEVSVVILGVLQAPEAPTKVALLLAVIFVSFLTTSSLGLRALSGFVH